MTRDEVVALMRQCAPVELKNGNVNEQQLDDLMPLVQLIVAVEREECAKLCSEVETQKPFGEHSWAALSCAAAIRGRK